MASNNPQDYIHPIIQTILAQQQGAMDKQKFEEVKKQNELQQKNEEADRALREKQLNDAIKMHEQESQLAIDNLKLNQQKQRFDAIQAAQKFAESGGDISKFETKSPVDENTPLEMGQKGIMIPKPQDTGEIDFMGIKIPKNAIPGYEDLAAKKAKAAAAEASAIAGAKEPFLQKQRDWEAEQDHLKSERDARARMDLQRAADFGDMERLKINLASAERRTQWEIAQRDRESKDRLRSAVSLGSTGAADTAEGYIKALTSAGTMKIENINDKNLRSYVVGEMQRRNLTPLRPKDVEPIRAIGTAGKLIDLLKDWAYADTGPITGFQSYTGLGDSDAARLSAEFGTLIPKYIQQFNGGDKRITDAEQRLMRGVHRESASPKENLKAVDDLIKNVFVPNFNNLLSAYSDEQKKMILDANGVDPNILEMYKKEESKSKGPVEVEVIRDSKTGKLIPKRRGDK